MTLKYLGTPKVKIALISISLILGLYFLFGAKLGVQKITFQDALSVKASEKIDETLKKNLVVFATVSTIKATLALIEGSSLGVGFELEVGDLVQPAYDYIDFVWRLFLYAILILTFYKLVIESGILGLGIQIVGIALLLWGLSFIWAKKKEEIKLWARRCFALGVLIAYIVPLILIGSNYLSSLYTAPLKEKTSQKYLMKLPGSQNQNRSSLI